MTIDELYAEDINYWQTSQSSPDTWMRRTRTQITKLGGRIIAEAFGSELETGRAAYMLMFEIGGEHFKAVWPVLPTRKGNERAARIQAATMLYHDVKQRCISSMVLGIRAAFFAYLQLPDGRTASTLATPELLARMPKLLGPARANWPE